MASAKARTGTSSNATKAKSDKARPNAPSSQINPDRGDNKVPFEAENIEHTIRRAMREKEQKRRKNPGLYL